MSMPASRLRLSRRQVLSLLAVSGTAAAGGYALFEYMPWLNYNERADEIRKPFEYGLPASAKMRELVGYGILAANGHNTQPWTFEIIDQTIKVYPDHRRRLSAVDPNDRELWISLGCALENLLISARAAGYGADVTYPDEADFIRVDLKVATPLGSRLFDAIPLRQNTRSIYDGQPVPTVDLNRLQGLPLEPGVLLKIVTGQNELATVLDYVNQGNLQQFANKAFVDELIHWLRFNKKEALASLDGLYSRCSGIPEVPRWLGQFVVAGTKPAKQADTDAKKLRSSAGAVVIASTSDDETAWVRTGQVYERLALTMTSLNIKSAFLNQPIEVAAVRSQFQSAMQLGPELPQLLLRFGYADAMTRSVRRPVEQVIVRRQMA